MSWLIVYSVALNIGVRGIVKMFLVSIFRWQRKVAS